MFLGYDAVNVKCDKVTTLALPHPKKTILLLKLQHSIDCFMLFFHRLLYDYGFGGKAPQKRKNYK